MSRFFAPAQLATAHLILTTLALIWNLWIAGRAARLHSTPRPLAFLSAVSGLMIIPSLTILFGTASLLTGRVLVTIAWFWPLTATLVAAQATYALARGLAAPPIALPIAAYDVVVALVAIAHWAMRRGLDPAAPLVALAAADTGALAFSAQPNVLLAPWYVHVPLLAPATPGRRGFGTVLRTAVAALAAAWGALIVVDVPNATRAVTSYDRYARERLTERADSEFVIGLKVFPTLDAAPPPLAVQSDLGLADTLGVGALSVYVAPRITANALDSLEATLADDRTDKQLIVALDLSRAPRLRSTERMAWLFARIPDLERVVRRVHPDIVVPVVDPLGAAARGIGPLPPDRWIAYLRESARAVHRIDPKIRVMAHVGGFTAADSALYSWAAAAHSPMDLVSLSLFPWLGGAATLDARIRTADAWLRSVPLAKDHWILEAGGFPQAHGESAQARALWGTLSWATSRAIVRGLVVFEASDYGAPVGLRDAGGRVRPAATLVRTAIRSISENAPS